MPVRQYIGARYVPTYYKNSQDPTSSEWEPNVMYDPLTIVSLSNMHSYQSKKMVPANIGSPAQNPEYWYDQGYAQAYYQALQDQIDDMKNGTVAGSLQNQIDTNASDITALANRIEVLEDWSSHNVLFVGDSYGTQTTNWCDQCATRLNLTNYTNLSVSGEGFTTGTGGNGFLNQISTYAGDKPAVTDIIIGGGLNDSTINDPSGAAALGTAIYNFAAYAASNYPNAKIWLAYIGIAIDTSSVLSGRTFDKRTWAEFGYKTGADDNKWAYIDILSHLKTTSAYIAADGVHPSIDGGKKIGRVMADYLRGRFYKAQYPYMSPTLTYDTYTRAYGSINYEVTDNSVNFYIDNWAFNVPNGQAITGVATLTGMVFNKDYTEIIKGRVDAFDNVAYKTVDIAVKFTGNKIKLAIVDVNGASFPTYTATGTNGNIVLLPHMFKIPLAIVA